MIIQGRVTKILPALEVTSKSGNTFKKLPFVLTYKKHENYPKAIALEIFGEDKIAEYNLNVTGVYEMDIDFEVREWNGKLFNDIRVNSVRPISVGTPPVTPSQQVPTTQPVYNNSVIPTPQPAPENIEPSDDLPF